MASAVTTGHSESPKHSHACFITENHLQAGGVPIWSCPETRGQWRQSMDGVNGIVFLETRACIVLANHSAESNLNKHA